MSRPPRSLRNVVNHHDLRDVARRKLPRVVFDFIDGGVEDEATLKANRTAFERYAFRPRNATNAVPSLDVSVLGSRLGMPVLAAPCGPARIIHPDGEKAVARAAAATGAGYVVPHMGGHSLEAVRAATDGELWYQIYKIGGRSVAEPAIRRAWKAGYRVLVVTIDNTGRRERDDRNGLSALISGDFATALPRLPGLLRRPGWLFRFLRDGMPIEAPNAIGSNGRPLKPSDIMVLNRRNDPTPEWTDFSWIRDAWPGAIVAKGVLTAEDAELAIEHGVTAIVVSNHGGRGYDHQLATLDALPEIVAAVNDRCDIIFDSGIRRGSDVVKALCIGAKAVLVGRLTMFGLAAGEPGVRKALVNLKAEIMSTMRGLGCASVAELGTSQLAPVRTEATRVSR